MTDRCANTIHSNYVSDHRCQLPKGHEGDCLFGRASSNRVPMADRIAYLLDDGWPTDDIAAQIAEEYGHSIPNRAEHQRDLEDAETLRQLGRDVPDLKGVLPAIQEADATRNRAAEYDPHEGEEQCAFCGEWRGPDGFEDGLRCKHCVEEQDADE